AIVAGGSFPGALIQGNKVGFPYHWHGLLQRGSAWLMVLSASPSAQSRLATRAHSCMILPLLIRLECFGYHSHYSTQYCDGLRDPFVVYDP
ncbi:hypothetical protein BDN72DRAFT_943735, partial [Pluteus cervinus]